MKARSTTKPQTLKVGNCPCGKPIMIAERYAVSLIGSTTINRKCDGFRCGRTNAIVLHQPSREVQRATWKALDCRCGAGIYLRSDYAGVGFSGWDTEGKSQYDLMVERKGDNKNRTIKADCSRCDCKYTVRIRFTREKDASGIMQNYRSINGSTVKRCKACAYRAPAMNEAS